MEEVQEVYAYTMNDVDKKYLSNEFYLHFFTLSKYEYWSRWWIYLNNNKVRVGYDADGQLMKYWLYTYQRNQIALGIKRKKYRQYKNEYKFADKTCMSGDWNKDAWEVKINPEDEQWESRDSEGKWDTVGGQLMRYETSYNTDMNKYDAKQLCYRLSPSKKNSEIDDTYQIHMEAEPCWKVLSYARPVCVVEGPNVPDSIKN